MPTASAPAQRVGCCRYCAAAEKGVPAAQCKLALALLRPLPSPAAANASASSPRDDSTAGVAVATESALALLRAAAAQSEPEALCNLAICHARGIGVARDEAAAAELYHQAAAAGLADAQAC